ncbi:MAG: 16S rRNA (uracil(1498)-N(3))-methyltransferase [Proteobacteria bacterium]|nr:16S rRNA (uracil(1498)-N(3))-methyltransferase [Pseudomonadota bacterium]
MRITRLYHPDDLICGETTVLDSNSSNHLIRVLRSKTGTDIILFNGDGHDYLCATLDDNPKKTTVLINSRIRIDNESNLSITLIQGLSRQDRMETTIQKSVELGVNRIIPVLSQRSNVRLNKNNQQKKHEHWLKVCISACEQSGRSIIPEVAEILSLDEIRPLLNKNAQRFTLNPDASTSFKNIDSEEQDIEIFIGPEGGLTEEEIYFLKENDFEDIRFGPRILRTETAGPAVISAIQMLWGDF